MTKNRSRAKATIGTGRPLADKLIKKMRRTADAKIVDFSAVLQGKQNADSLQQTIATREELARFHPAHAIYVYAQNQVSILAEQLTMLPEMDRFSRLIGKAEDEYFPGGPPMSPITTSFFTCWAFFDACVGLAQETLGTTIMAFGKIFGMHEDLVRVIGLMQDSHMGVYVQEGTVDGRVVLRELVTNRTCTTIDPTGYFGSPGELWYARVLPPALRGAEEHVLFTTPYVLIESEERDWLAYFDRTLPQGTHEQRIAAYERHMKWGPTRNYWTEYVFEAYVNHRHEAIFLTGYPDIPESRPHSPVNS